MSINVRKQVISRGDDSYAEAAWRLKEEIRSDEDVLKQRRGFFMRAYQRTRVHMFLAGPPSRDDEGTEDGADLIGFAAARSDGYILFLAVASEHRGEGYGARLVYDVVEECGTATCHARATNGEALGFYDHLGFETVRRIDSYYEDGGTAYYLKLGDGDRLVDRISELLRR